MRPHEGCALDFGSRAVLEGLAGAAALRTHQYVVEHRRAGYVTTSAEGYFLCGGRLTVSIGIIIKVTADDNIKRIGANLRIYIVFQKVPAATAGIEATGQLRGDVAVVEHLIVGCNRSGTLCAAKHVTLVAAASGLGAVILQF